MSTAFAAAIRERARQAWQALQQAREDDDVHAGLAAKNEWADVRRLAREHGVSLDLGPQVEEEADS
ncbi:hypothetical protein ACFYY8_04320 [Streptosporangium sp. NPDC001559]|uniref:hypothetical protein n=1 Tax=Streptosporangium sp. NPDC001559 TaxID=3366187 RepID=UPI0036E9A410